MSAPGAVYPVLASEKCSLRELWRSPSHVARGGWTLVGSPTVLNGLHLDGVGQYAHRPAVHGFNSPEITFPVWFTPNFNYDDGVVHTLYDTSIGSRYYAMKREAGSGNALQIYLGNVNIASIPAGTYGPYWKQGERNLLVVSSASGNTNVRLNGQQVLTSDPSVWSPTPPDTVYVGCNAGLVALFDGIIHSFEIFNEAWDATQEAAFRNNRVFAALGQSDCHLPMRTQMGTGVVGDEYRTPDRSGKGRVCLLGDGVTPAKMPIFINPGFHFLPVHKYIDVLSFDGLTGGPEQTFVICFRPNFSFPTSTSQWLFCCGKDAVPAYNMELSVGGTWFKVRMGKNYVHTLTSVPMWRRKGWNVAISTSAPSDNDLWFNGELLSHTTTAWTPTDVENFVIGAYFTYALAYRGDDIRHFSVYPFKFSATQARELSHRLLTGAA